MNIDKIICINLRLDNKQLSAISLKYNIGFQWLMKLKQSHYHIWVETDIGNKHDVNDVSNLLIASKSEQKVAKKIDPFYNHNGYAFHINGLSDAEEAAVLKINPIKTPKLTKSEIEYLKSPSNPGNYYVVEGKVVYNDVFDNNQPIKKEVKLPKNMKKITKAELNKRLDDALDNYDGVNDEELEKLVKYLGYFK